MINSRITLFGDSLGKGIVTFGNERKVAENNAVKLFEKKYSVSIDNRSRFGETLARSACRGVFKKFAESFDRSQKNAVVIELGNNDCSYDWRSVAKDPNAAHTSFSTLEDFTMQYEKTVEDLRASGAEVFCCSLVPINAKRYFDNVIGSLCDKEKVLEFFKGDYTVIYRHHEMFSNAVTALCKSLQVPLIDLRTPFLDELDLNGLLCGDGIHPNELGQKKMFEAVCKFTESYLA